MARIADTYCPGSTLCARPQRFGQDRPTIEARVRGTPLFL
nr:hypothetical protein JVH1_7684 [Rhodococcus sp. JVH1]